MANWTKMNAPPAPLPADAHMTHDLTGGLMLGPHRHRRERIYYVLTVDPPAGAATIAVEEACNRCGEHGDTGTIASATGEPIRAGDQYSAPAGGGPVRKAGAYHVDPGQVGSRRGLRYPSGTETVKPYRLTWTDKSAPGNTWVSMGDETWFELPPRIHQIGSYILWDDPAPPRLCDLDKAFGVDLLKEVLELGAAPAKPVRGEPVPV